MMRNKPRDMYLHIQTIVMTIWKHCTVDTLFFSEDPAVTNELGYQVKIDDKEIVVSYQDSEWVEYRGKNKGDGHFQLSCPERKGEASLHQFPGGKILEGFWIENGYQGMWRIKLS